MDSKVVVQWEGPGRYSPVHYPRKRYDLVVLVFAFGQPVADTINVSSIEYAAQLGSVVQVR